VVFATLQVSRLCRVYAAFLRAGATLVRVSAASVRVTDVLSDLKEHIQS
jgi:hypothetical protein